MRQYAVFETELGWIGLLRSAAGLCRSTLPRLSPLVCLQELQLLSSDVETGEQEFAGALETVRALLDGHSSTIANDLDLSSGTAFQQAVWSAIREIPLGQTRSYAWVAEAIGRPLGAHAVGQAVAKNPLPLFVPCHRVIRASGELGGYGRSYEALATKRSLLKREGVCFDGPTLEQIRGITAGQT